MTEMVQDEQRAFKLCEGNDLSPIKSLISAVFDSRIGPPCAPLVLRVWPEILKKIASWSECIL
jgi:hypothetical protein